MKFNCQSVPDLDLASTYLKLLEEDNYQFSLVEIAKMSSTRLEDIDLQPVMSKVKSLIDELGNYLDIREDAVVRLDANMMNCVEILFSSRRDVKVNLYISNRTYPYMDLPEPDFDEDEMYFTYKQNNRRRIMHGTMADMIKELKKVLRDK